MPETNKPSVEIVPALPKDAATICDIRDQAWLQTYPNAALGITPENISMNAKGPNGEFVPRRIAYLQERFAKNSQPDATTYVAKLDGRVVGYIEPRLDEHGRRCISALYVAPNLQHTGIGGMLMRHVLNLYGRDRDIYLEVVSYNDNAIGFYRHFGFEPTDAAVPEEEGRPAYLTSLPQTEMVLRAITA